MLQFFRYKHKYYWQYHNFSSVSSFSFFRWLNLFTLFLHYCFFWVIYCNILCLLGMSYSVTFKQCIMQSNLLIPRLSSSFLMDQNFCNDLGYLFSHTVDSIYLLVILKYFVEINVVCRDFYQAGFANLSLCSDFNPHIVTYCYYPKLTSELHRRFSILRLLQLMKSYW